MKTKSITLLLLSALILFNVGCHKKENVTPENDFPNKVKNSVLLSRDESYNQYLQDFSNFLNQKKDTETIKRLMKQEALSENDKEIFAIAIGFKSKEEFERFGLLQASRLKQLDVKYNIKQNSEKTMAEFVGSSLLKLKAFSQSKVAVAPSNGGDGEPVEFGLCERKYTNCLAIATATGVAAHIACLSVDWATAGVGFYVCHGAATLLQTAMSDNCVIDYNECLKPKSKA